MPFKENSQKVVSDLIDGEMMLLNMEAGHYYSLVGAGAPLWSLICQGTTREALLESLNTAYPAGEAKSLEADLDQFLESLRAEELISECAEAQSTTIEFGKVYIAPKLATYSDLQDLLLLDPIHDVDETGWPAAAS